MGGCLLLQPCAAQPSTPRPQTYPAVASACPTLASVRGLSLTSFSSELLCYMVSVAYNVKHGYAFSTFGDTGGPWAGHKG